MTVEVVDFVYLVMSGSEHNTNLPWSATQRSGKHVVPPACPAPKGKVLNLCLLCCLFYDDLGWFDDVKTLLACAYHRLDGNSLRLSSTGAFGTRRACAWVRRRWLPCPAPPLDCYLLIVLARPLRKSSASARLTPATVLGICEFWRRISWKEAHLKCSSRVRNMWNQNFSLVLMEARLQCLDHVRSP